MPTTSHPELDPESAITFDLAHGLLHLPGAPERVLVPADALVVLAAIAGPDASERFGRTWGESMGRRVAFRFSSTEGVERTDVVTVVEHFAAEIALVGLGALGLERWGKAVVLVVDQSPLGARGDTLLAEVLAGAVEAATLRRVRTLLLARDRVRARFLVGSAAAIVKVDRWLNEGVTWGEALVRLHEATGVAEGTP
jgi:hypothetical protein